MALSRRASRTSMARSPKYPRMKLAELGACSMPSFSSPAAQQFPRREGFRDVVRDEFRILHRGFGRQRRQHVHAVGRLGFVQILDVGRLREQTAHPHGGHPVDLGKCAADEEVRVILDQRQSGDPAEFVVGFVDQDGGLRGAVEDLFDGGECRLRCRWDCSDSRSGWRVWRE